MRAEIAVKTDNTLGEGPVWSVPEQALYWVDIWKPALCRWHPVSGERQMWLMPAPIGSFVLRHGGGAVVALKTGLFLFDFETEAFELLSNPEAGRTDTRFNDGKCDRQGRFWAGTMDDDGESEPKGTLYRLDRDLSLHKIRERVIVSNGLGWSPDNKTMYYTDSPLQTIFAYDFDPDSGSISNERVFAQDTVGFPDGLTVDSEGYVWSAKWDGWRITRYAPDGTIDREVEMDVQKPTSCTFGGPDMNQLYITTARIGIDPDKLRQQPLAGCVLVLETEVTGLPEPRFAG
jgi:L-arabinonolactonase